MSLSQTLPVGCALSSLADLLDASMQSEVADGGVVITGAANVDPALYAIMSQCNFALA